MQEIVFPGVNLNMKISRVALNIFGINIYWYAIIIAVAIIIALIILKKRDGLYDIQFEKVLELSIIVIPISIICARIYYCIFNFEYYINHPIKILDIKAGGLAIYGGIIGGAVTAIIYSKKQGIDIMNLLDYIVPSLALGQAIGRWGNFVNIEAYGTRTNALWRMGIIENGNYIEVHPTFLYESIATLIIFFILMKLKNKRTFKGEVTYVYLLLYSFVRFFIEGLRTDSLMLCGYRISQIVSVIIFIISITMIIYNRKCKYPKSSI